VVEARLPGLLKMPVRGGLVGGVDALGNNESRFAGEGKGILDLSRGSDEVPRTDPVRDIDGM
jgi:hypothetical protein